MTKNKKNGLFRSGDLTVYPQSGQVEINGQVIKLALVNMQVLLTLLEHGGEVVSRSNFFESVWKNQTVSDDTLTRCISELRSQLGKFSSQPSLIETLPKRGYRWVPPVSYDTGPPSESEIRDDQSGSGGWKKVAGILLASLGSLLLFSMGVLWLIDFSLRPELVRVALVPVYAGQTDQRALAADLDDILKDQLLSTRNLRFFAKSATRDGSQSSFPFAAQELGVQWIIEGDIRHKQEKVRVSLNLVDAKTALVVYSLTQDLDNDPVQLRDLCSMFVEEVLQVLEL